MNSYLKLFTNRFETQVFSDVIIIGQQQFEAEHSPIPDMTHSIRPGQSFKVMETISQKDLRQKQKQKGWVLCVPVDDPSKVPKRIPLDHCALEGTLGIVLST